MNEPIKNRNEAYKSILPELGMRQKTVYNLLEHYGCLTSQEIAKKMVLGVNQITPRIKELREMFLVESNGSKINASTGRKNIAWVLTPKEGQNALKSSKKAIYERKLKYLRLDFANVYFPEAKDVLLKEIESLKNKISKL